MTQEETQYNIFVRNLQAQEVEMWLFLEAPKFDQPPDHIYQNSSTSLQVIPYDRNYEEKFVAKVEYSMAVGSQTDPVEVGNEVIAMESVPSPVNNGYNATFSSQKGDPPSIVPGKTDTPPTRENLVIDTNSYTAPENWNYTMTFGVKTSYGASGVTWVPSPNFEYIIYPTLTFYVAVGEYNTNKLAKIQAGSLQHATLNTEQGAGSFDSYNNAWVTYERNGQWSVQTTKW